MVDDMPVAAFVENKREYQGKSVDMVHLWT